jgi:type VI secretion system secreted protein Hcp
MKRRIILASLVVAALAAAGTAYAVVSQAAATQTVNACVNDEGQLRLAPSSGSCKKNEQLLSWNTVGPAGPAGPTGATGPAGPAGPAGPQGVAGPSAGSPPDPDAVAATITATGQKSGKIADGLAVTAVSHEIQSPRDVASGLPTGKRVHKPITITMSWGSSTPLFIDALVSNENLTTMEIDLLQSGATIAKIKLTNADVSDYQLHGTAVTLSFTYQKIEWATGSTTVEDSWESST